jgi:hypothetical protein
MQGYDHLRPCPLAITFDDRMIGVCMLRRGQVMGGLLQAVTIDRGPLFINPDDALLYQAAFWNWFHRQYPKRLGRRRRLIPEFSNEDQQIDFGVLRPIPPYQTSWIDLGLPEETLKKNMRKNWRHSLRQAETQNVIIQDQVDDKNLRKILLFAAQQNKSGQQPAHFDFLYRLSAAFRTSGQLYLFYLTSADRGPLAGGIFYGHGKAVTWQVGFVTEAGRSGLANYAMLWAAIRAFRRRGFCYLDLGGLINQENSGLNYFKQGLGGEDVQFVGQYS